MAYDLMKIIDLGWFWRSLATSRPRVRS